ncbi:MAG: lysozyme [Bacteroidales bacterium]|nr:lysozyme [Bacteroidales bacterium]
MKISDYAFEKIKDFEGLRLKAYLCSGGKWTIGYGHTKGVHEGMVITRQEADRLLEEDILYFENFLSKEKYAEDITQGQWDALVSFIFNLGIGNFICSTLRNKILINIDEPTIPDEFRKWVFAKGKKLQGLVKRREWEAQMYEWE